MTPAEIIKQQAEKITGFDKLSAAEHLEAAAKLLRGEAAKRNNPVAELRAWKEQARAKGAGVFAAIAKDRQDKVNNALADGGWSHLVTFEANGMQHFVKPNVQGTKLVIMNGKFKVFAADTVICDWTETKYLQSWVDKQKKK
jgi:hypothetical protein